MLNIIKIAVSRQNGIIIVLDVNLFSPDLIDANTEFGLLNLIAILME
jgi:hypothetical protein